MPCLPHDPSIFIDGDSIAEIVEALSLRLRKSRTLRPVLDRIVGNHWLEFELGLGDFLLKVLLLEGGHELAVEIAFSYDELFQPELIEEIGCLFLESSLATQPFHAAASITEITERISTNLLQALKPETMTPDERKHQLLQAMKIIIAGQIFR
jgi:hypothetical protein